MAATFGGFYFDEEVFTQMMSEQDYWNTDLIDSGALVVSPDIMDAIGEKGNAATIPMYNPLSVLDTNMAPLNNDGVTNNVPVEVSGKKQSCIMIQRMKAFKAKDFIKELTGADPLGDVAKKLGNYYRQVWIREMMNIVKATMGVSALSDHVTNLAVTSGTVGAANKITETTLIDAEQAALGDMAGGAGLLVMHSKIYAAYKKLKMVEFDKHVVSGVIEQEILLPRIGGKHVIVTDRDTVDTTVASFPVYHTYTLGEGSLLTCDKSNYKRPYYADYDPETAGGVEMLYTKQGKVIHPNGINFDITAPVTDSPTFAEMGTSSNYSLVNNGKNVRIGVIKSNG